MEDITGQGGQNQPVPADGYAPAGYDVNLNQPFLKNLCGWATFKAIFDIIIGIFGIIGIYGIFQIISGVKLLNAVDDLKRFSASDDKAKILDSFNNLNKYFKFSGISAIVQIIFVIIVIIGYVALVMYMFSNPEFMQRFFNNLDGSF